MNCSFNIRYKPRTTRAFTKSDLTVYDSAGNTALNALTVYGKSEVVDGSIKSAGEGWSTVDLGTLNYTYNSTYDVFIISNIQYATIDAMLCSNYEYASGVQSWSQLQNKQFAAPYGIQIAFKNTSYTDAETFKTAMSGVLLCYPLADPSQGNAIAVKTDNGTGIDGTMGVFETGTPLRGIPETDVRDVMVWDGSSGEVMKNCGVVDLGTLSWNYATSAAGTKLFISSIPSNIKRPPTSSIVPAIVCAKYTVKSWEEFNTGVDAQNGITVFSTDGSVRIVDSAYNDAATFKTAMSGVMLVYELATPTTEQMTTAENDSIAGLRTFEPQTHAQNNAQTEMTVDYTIRVPTI